MTLPINPRVIYQGSVDKDGVINAVTRFFLLTIATNNQTLVTAISGKVIRVLRVVVSSTTATASYVVLKSASGGTNLCLYTAPIITAPSLIDSDEYGLMDTNVGEGLFVDCPAASAVYISVKYLSFTP